MQGEVGGEGQGQSPLGLGGQGGIGNFIQSSSRGLSQGGHMIKSEGSHRDEGASQRREAWFAAFLLTGITSQFLV